MYFTNCLAFFVAVFWRATLCKPPQCQSFQFNYLSQQVEQSCLIKTGSRIDCPPWINMMYVVTETSCNCLPLGEVQSHVYPWRSYCVSSYLSTWSTWVHLSSKKTFIKLNIRGWEKAMIITPAGVINKTCYNCLLCKHACLIITTMQLTLHNTLCV